MNSGIYQIRNIINHKIYIGSTNNFKTRKRMHFSELKHCRHHNTYLQNSYNKYGVNNFVFEILKHCEIEKLFEIEQQYIDKLKPDYNIGAVGYPGNMLNHPKIDKIKEQRKLSRLKYLANLTEEQKQQMRDRNLGANNPAWTGGKVIFVCPVCKIEIPTARSVKNKKTCRKCMPKLTGDKNPFYGKKHSEETKNKIRITNMMNNKSKYRAVEINNVKYNSISEASRALNITHSKLTRLLNKYKSGYNYINK